MAKAIIGQEIKRIVKKRGMTVEELALALNVSKPIFLIFIAGNLSIPDFWRDCAKCFNIISLNLSIRNTRAMKTKMSSLCTKIKWNF